MMMARHHIRGTTLVELMIAMVILVSLLVALTEGLVATVQTESLDYAEDELSESALRVRDAISADLAASGWHFVSDASGAYPTIDPNKRPRTAVLPVCDSAGSRWRNLRFG